MARISNTSSYPIIVPDGADYFILTDAENSNATKNIRGLVVRCLLI